jgi:hypothetical protein
MDVAKETFSNEMILSLQSNHLVPHRADHDAIAIALTIKKMWERRACFDEIV